MAGREDKWAFVKIGNQFPEHPVRVRGVMNMYVALWYKHGAPVCGRAWMNGGVVECSFPYNGKELTGARDLGGEIQILTNPEAEDAESSFARLGFWYEWVPYSHKNQPHLKMVRCGNAAPILLQGKNGQTYLGSVDLSKDTAAISYGGKEEKTLGLANQLIICRNFKKPPEKGELILLGGGEDHWTDRRVNDKMPPAPVVALGRPLNNEDGSRTEHCVALWYKHGEPVMGRCWKNPADNIQATFGWAGKEFAGDVGSIQVLQFTDAKGHGYEYTWLPYSQAVRNTDKWRPVHVADVAPCVIKTSAGHERLGQVKLHEEEAGVAWGGKEEVYRGTAVQDFMVLCRRP